MRLAPRRLCIAVLGEKESAPQQCARVYGFKQDMDTAALVLSQTHGNRQPLQGCKRNRPLSVGFNTQLPQRPASALPPADLGLPSASAAPGEGGPDLPAAPDYTYNTSRRLFKMQSTLVGSKSSTQLTAMHQLLGWHGATASSTPQPTRPASASTTSAAWKAYGSPRLRQQAAAQRQAHALEASERGLKSSVPWQLRLDQTQGAVSSHIPSVAKLGGGFKYPAKPHPVGPVLPAWVQSMPAQTQPPLTHVGPAPAMMRCMKSPVPTVSGDLPADYGVMAGQEFRFPATQPSDPDAVRAWGQLLHRHSIATHTALPKSLPPPRPHSARPAASQPLTPCRHASLSGALSHGPNPRQHASGTADHAQAAPSSCVVLEGAAAGSDSGHVAKQPSRRGAAEVGGAHKGSARPRSASFASLPVGRMQQLGVEFKPLLVSGASEPMEELIAPDGGAAQLHCSRMGRTALNRLITSIKLEPGQSTRHQLLAASLEAEATRSSRRQSRPHVGTHCRNSTAHSRSRSASPVPVQRYKRDGGGSPDPSRAVNPQPSLRPSFAHLQAHDWQPAPQQLTPRAALLGGPVVVKVQPPVRSWPWGSEELVDAASVTAPGAAGAAGGVTKVGGVGEPARSPPTSAQNLNAVGVTSGEGGGPVVRQAMPSCAVGRHATSSAAGSADGEAALRSDGEEGEEDEVLDVGALTLSSETAHSHVKTSMQDRDAAPRVEASDSMVLLTQASEAELQSHSSHTAWHGNSEVPGLSHRQAVAIAQITGPALGGGRGSSERQGGDLGEELPLMRGPGEENVEAEPGWAARRRPVSASPGSRETRSADARWHGGMGSAIGVMPGVQEECEEDGEPV
ncbi:hypothetical protein V8C86DRAFT_2532627 [Haematococcus lacustris]